MVIHTKDHAETYTEAYFVNDADRHRRSLQESAADTRFMATPISHV